MPEWLNNIDTQLFLDLNSAHSSFFDVFFILITSLEVWFPIYLLLVFMLIKKYKVNGLWVILFFVITVVISDQLSGLIKDVVQRLRPSHEPMLIGKVNNLTGKGGLYGFVSGHATNVFSLAVLVSMLSKNRVISILFFSWAVIVSYSRIYVGVHYPLDLICGGILGALIGWGIYLLLTLFDKKYRRKAIFGLGPWAKEDVWPFTFAFIFIFCTLLISSKIIGTHIIN